MRSLFLLSILAALAAACGNGDSTSGSSGSSGSSGGTTCERDGRKDVYAQGLAKESGGITVKIADAEPAPPLKGENALVLEISDAAGAPIDGATVTITPFMPDHGHGSAVAPVVAAKGDGRYEVTEVYLAMAGLWTITVTVQPAGGEAQDVTFAFCLEG
jgi:hypothetical protein